MYMNIFATPACEGGRLAELLHPGSNKREAEKYSEGKNVYYGPQHIFVSLYGCKPCGRGRGLCLAVMTCDLETGSVVVQKRRQEGER